jgi:hypothetical protein
MPRSQFVQATDLATLPDNCKLQLIRNPNAPTTATSSVIEGTPPMLPPAQGIQTIPHWDALNNHTSGRQLEDLSGDSSTSPPEGNQSGMLEEMTVVCPAGVAPGGVLKVNDGLTVTVPSGVEAGQVKSRRPSL